MVRILNFKVRVRAQEAMVVIGAWEGYMVDFIKIILLKCVSIFILFIVVMGFCLVEVNLLVYVIL